MDGQLRDDVQMQFLRPQQLDDAVRKCPVVYVPFGLIEWHGPHLPLGNDALKAHGICCKAAELGGGVVYPPVYFHSGFNQQHLVPVLSELFERLTYTGFRVFLGVSGHNIKEQLDMIENALRPVLADEGLRPQDKKRPAIDRDGCRGAASYEFPIEGDRAVCSSDHAAKWETSNMMFFYPHRVDMATLDDWELTGDMKQPPGIGGGPGGDPKKYASVERGRRNVEVSATALAAKALALLESLPLEKRGMRIPGIRMGCWWAV